MNAMLLRPCAIAIALSILCSCDRPAGAPQRSAEKPAADVADTAGTVRITDGMEEIRANDGSLRMRGPKVDGLRHGTWTSFFPNGMIRSRGQFEQGIQHGSTEVYHESGLPYYTGQYHQGNPTGEWNFYSADGTHLKTVLYDTLGHILEQR